MKLYGAFSLLTLKHGQRDACPRKGHCKVPRNPVRLKEEVAAAAVVAPGLLEAPELPATR
jgi:hypothetical protein